MSVIEDEEQEAMKGEHLKDEHSLENSSVGSQPLEGKWDLSPSSSIRRSSW